MAKTPPICSNDPFRPIGVKPDSSGVYHLAFTADWHIGNKSSAISELRNFIDTAYAANVRLVCCAGDILEGNLAHFGAVYGQSEVGFDAQVNKLLKILPQYKGLKYYFCYGSHDVVGQKALGMDSGKALENEAISRGRNDIVYLGQTQGRIVLGQGRDKIKIELAHPRISSVYAKSGPVQRWIDATPLDQRSDICVTGHLHGMCCVEVEGTIGLQPGCFCHTTPFEQERGLHPAVGGVIASVRKHNGKLDFTHRFIRYPSKTIPWNSI
jgi:predicted phosphodiesterase